MKKGLLLIMLFLVAGLPSKAQFHFTSTVKTSSTNEFLQIPAFFLESIVNVGWGTVTGDKILFAPQLVFPRIIKNNAPAGFCQMKSGYARAFSAPWKYLGDYSIGISGNWDHYENPLGFYIGLNYNSREVVFEDADNNDRAHYLSPELGLCFKFGERNGFFMQLGASYDYVFKYNGGVHDYEKDAVNDGISLNVGIGLWDSKGPCQLNFQLPVYNFYNRDFTPDNGSTYPFKDVNRQIAYISFLYRRYIEY